MNKKDTKLLDHTVERLLASRYKPKRQYFVERVAYLWSPRRSCFQKYRGQAVLTEESAEALTSFADDSSDVVRQKVAQALGTTLETAKLGQNALEKLLKDKEPLVRLQAANSSLKGKLFEQFPKDLVLELLQDKVWSVRWYTAQGLANTNLHEKAWMVLMDSVPKASFHLLRWTEAAMKLADLTEYKLQLKGVLKKASVNNSDDYFTELLRDDLRRLEESL